MGGRYGPLREEGVGDGHSTFEGALKCSAEDDWARFLALGSRKRELACIS